MKIQVTTFFQVHGRRCAPSQYAEGHIGVYSQDCSSMPSFRPGPRLSLGLALYSQSMSFTASPLVFSAAHGSILVIFRRGLRSGRRPARSIPSSRRLDFAIAIHECGISLVRGIPSSQAPFNLPLCSRSLYIRRTAVILTVVIPAACPERNPQGLNQK
ncbi:hypothetical protein PLICRDRAFT_246225 [Plicaturopsis crispa FD-325 SS-3]|nr:hypothetical protein PLICRDRAFT_246225 [Plicaturopsis crispa FD-325 SS-3]